MIFWIKIRIACIKSILHWSRLRKWVAKQESDLVVSNINMDDSLGECPSVGDCALCVACYSSNVKIGCTVCLLMNIGECCIRNTKSAYQSVSNSSTWGEWFINSKYMVNALWKALFLG